MENPFPALKKLRAEAPVFYCKDMNGWIITRYKDVSQLFNHPLVVAGNLTEQVKNQMKGHSLELVKDYLRIRNQMMLHNDGKEHKRLRMPFNRIFLKGELNKLQPIIDDALEETLKQLRKKDKFDFATEFAEPFSTRVIAGLFDVPDNDREAFQQASDEVSRFFGTTLGDVERDAKIANDAILYLEKYFITLVEDKKKKPGQDLLSLFISMQDNLNQSEEEIIAQCILIMMAGHFTVIDQLCNSCHLFFNEGILESLRDNPDQISQAIEESIRLDGGVLFMGRVIKEDFEYNNVKFKANDTLFLGLGAGSRDPEVFEDPDKFSLDRGRIRHLGFGHSHHQCLGAELGRMELTSAYLKLLETFPHLQLLDGSKRKTESLFFRGFYSMPLSTLPL